MLSGFKSEYLSGLRRNPHVKVLGCRSAGMTCLDKVGHAHPQIQGIAMTHDPPPISASESQIGLAQNPGSRISSPVL
jgi:hypothetical protein